MGPAGFVARLASVLLLGLAWLHAPPASAQGLVERDGSLGVGELLVGGGLDPTGAWATYLISAEMGERHGANLFHSFWRFGVGAGETATFTGPDDVAHVISRVTGDEPSQIDGTLRSTIAGADLWLFNPNGVGFGAGAEVDVRGSFHAGAVDYVDLGDSGLERYYADRSLPSVLATAPPAAFGFLEDSRVTALAVDQSRLEVDPGKTLELVGGDLSLTAAELLAPGGHVALEAQGAVALSGSLVDVGRDGDTPGTISIRGGQIVIREGSQVLAENESPVPAADERPGPGSISVEAGESVLVDASLLSVNTSAAGNAGTIQVAAPVVTFQNGPGYDATKPPPRTEVGATAETASRGAGGEIQIHAGEILTVANGVGVSASAVGSGATGDAGSVEIVAEKVVVGKRSPEERGAHVSAETAGTGSGGSISIAAGESVLVDDGLLSVNTWGAGNAGTIRIGGLGEDQPKPDVTIQEGPGLPATNIPRVIEAGVRAGTTSSGAAGEIHIDAGALTIQHGVAVSADAVGTPLPPHPARGPAGTVEIHADSLELRDRSFIGASGWGSSGRAGTIRIDLGDGPLRVDRAGSLYTWIIANSNGIPGTIEIDAGSVAVSQGGIHASCNPNCIARPEPGPGVELPPNVWVKARDIRLDSGGGIFAGTNGEGDAGTIRIDADDLRLDSGGGIFVNTNGAGDGGTIQVDADTLTIRLAGIAADTIGSGNAGSIVINGGAVHVTDGGFINAISRTPPGAEVIASGRAGDIVIHADSVVLSGLAPDGIGPDGRPVHGFGSRILALSEDSTGNGGTIDLQVRTLEVERGGQINAGSYYRLPTGRGGKGGTLAIHADDWIDLRDGEAFSLQTSLDGTNRLTGILSATLFGLEGGQVDLDAREIRVRTGAVVATTTVGGAAAGDVVLRAERIRVEDGGIVDSTSLRTLASAGNVTLTASESIEVIGRHPDFDDPSNVSSGTRNQGAAGTVRLQAPRIVVDGGSVSTASVPFVGGGGGGAGGSIVLEGPNGAPAREILVRGGGRVEASTASSGDGGSVLAVASESIRVEGTDSGIASRTIDEGNAGRVELRAPTIAVAGGGEVSSRSEQGPEAFRSVLRTIVAGLRDSHLFAQPPPTATGDAGSIKLAASRLVHLDAGHVTTSVGVAHGGDIAIDPVFVILQRGGSITSEALEEGGFGGRIGITTDSFFAFPGSAVSAQGRTPELSGTVEIKSPDVNLAGTLAELPSSFLDASSQMRERCAARRGGERVGSFAVRGAGGIPAEPDGWLPAPMLPDAGAAVAGAPIPGPTLVASVPGPPLARGACW